VGKTLPLVNETDVFYVSYMRQFSSSRVGRASKGQKRGHGDRSTNISDKGEGSKECK
jgi:hypothetical protein